ncbi:hypothetical protein GQR58_026042 [Nymphon striatum]|nr:hypothetical protein GQR58_026042 [Nymphon striatum]
MESSLKVRGPMLFNIVPKKIRNMSGCKTDVLKRPLDKWLANIPDEPQIYGYTVMRRAESNHRVMNKRVERPFNCLLYRGGTLIDLHGEAFSQHTKRRAFEQLSSQFPFQEHVIQRYKDELSEKQQKSYALESLAVADINALDSSSDNLSPGWASVDLVVLSAAPWRNQQ